MSSKQPELVFTPDEISTNAEYDVVRQVVAEHMNKPQKVLEVAGLVGGAVVGSIINLSLGIESGLDAVPATIVSMGAGYLIAREGTAMKINHLTRGRQQAIRDYTGS